MFSGHRSAEEILPEESCGVRPIRIADDGHDVADCDRVLRETESVQDRSCPCLDIRRRRRAIGLLHLKGQVHVRIREPVLHDGSGDLDFRLRVVCRGTVVRQRRRRKGQRHRAGQ